MYEMTEKDYDKAWLVSEQISEEVVALVKARIKNLNEPQRDYVIQKLDDEFRFWRAQE